MRSCLDEMEALLTDIASRRMIGAKKVITSAALCLICLKEERHKIYNLTL